MGTIRHPVWLSIPMFASSRGLYQATLPCKRSELKASLQLHNRGYGSVVLNFVLPLLSLINFPFAVLKEGRRCQSAYFHVCRHWLSAFSGKSTFTRRRRRVVKCEAAGSAFSSPSDTNWNENVSSSIGHTFGERFRAVCFYITTCLVALPFFVVMLFVQPFVLVFDKNKRKAQHLINKIWANLTILLFYKVEIEGLENLPGPDESAVYVSNHQSFLDIYTLFLLNRPFKFISKMSIFLIPVIGWAMYLTGHVPLRRMDTKSQMECLKHCLDLVRQGVPVFFFPEGTRSKEGKLGYFKKGAFAIAAKANVPVVPISLIGTGKLMPSGREGTLRSGSVKVIIHAPLEGRDADVLCLRARSVIAQSLLKHGLTMQ